MAGIPSLPLPWKLKLKYFPTLLGFVCVCGCQCLCVRPLQSASFPHPCPPSSLFPIFVCFSLRLWCRTFSSVDCSCDGWSGSCFPCLAVFESFWFPMYDQN